MLTIHPYTFDFKNYILEHIPEDNKILDLWMEPYGMAVITAVDELGIFASLANNKYNIEILANKVQLDATALGIVCKVLTSYGFLKKINKNYYLTEFTKIYWTKKSIFYRGNEFNFYKENVLHQKIITMLKDGWAPFGENNKSFMEMWQDGDLTENAARNFTAFMHSIIKAPTISAVKSGVFKGIKSIIDVGGGSGIFCLAFVTLMGNVEATLMDLPPVCIVAEDYLKNHVGFNKIKIYPANFFKDHWPTGEAFYFSNILHDWSYETCKFLLTTAHASLQLGRKIFIYECLLNDNETSPHAVVLFNLIMYMNHKSQQFTFKKLSSLLIEVGFCNPRIVHTFGYYSLVQAEKI